MNRTLAAWIVAMATGASAEEGSWTISNEALKGVKNPIAAKQHKAAAERGRVVYQKECASCHGETGKGDGPDGLYFTVKPTDLTQAKVKGQRAEILFVKTTVGRNDMPAFEKTLSEAERWDVVHFMKSL